MESWQSRQRILCPSRVIVLLVLRSPVKINRQNSRGDCPQNRKSQLGHTIIPRKENENQRITYDKPEYKPPKESPNPLNHNPNSIYQVTPSSFILFLYLRLKQNVSICPTIKKATAYPN